MEKKSNFLRESSFYKRNVNPLSGYIEMSSFFISKVKGVSEDEAKSKILNSIKARKIEGVIDPKVRYYERSNYSDREIVELGLSAYIKSATDQDYILTPSFTCYVSTAEKKSFLVESTDQKTKERAIAKKKAAQAKANNKPALWLLYNGEQANKKLFNNSLSGAFSSFGNILRNPTSHSSLTSTTRIMTSIGNASNEKMISGNRHYRNFEVTLNNIVSLAKYANESELDEVMSKYNLVYPSVEDTMRCIIHSTQLYWRDDNHMAYIHKFISLLSPRERAGVVYFNDLYHLRIFNENVIRGFLTRLGSKVKGKAIDNPLDVIKDADELDLNFVQQVCMSEVRGMGKKHHELPIEDQCTVAATCLNVRDTVNEWRDFIQCFFLTELLPCSVAYIRSIIRRTVVLSDTDSSMFSCDEWVQWYFNEIKFNDVTYGISGSVMYLATQSIAHNIALYSANLGVERSKLFMAGMKPEFFFPVLALTNAAKHYYSYVLVQEGSVFKEPELERKGVHLISSAAPIEIIQDAEKRKRDILDTVMRGEKLSAAKHLKEVTAIEEGIVESVSKGERKYFRRVEIKNADAYTANSEESPYKHYVDWNKYWAKTYGECPLPPYEAFKIPLKLKNKSSIKLWLESMENKELANALTCWVETEKKTAINTFYLSAHTFDQHGIPKELFDAVDLDKLILDTTVSSRMILESLGIFIKPKTTLMGMGYRSHLIDVN